jgi:hypothetical protein
MSRLEQLPPDQRAALALLLAQRKSYAELAATLRISEHAVHDRAHAALAMLAPQLARGLAADQREQVGDYLLGQQQGVAERLATRTLLKESQPARAWARELSDALAPLAAQPLPQIPAADGAAPAGDDGGGTPPAVIARPPAGAAGTPPAGAFGERSGAAALPSSRLGGALVLAVIVAAIVVAVVLLTKGDSSHSSNAASSTVRKAAKTTTTGPHIDQRFTISSPTPGSSAVGAVAFLSEGSKRAFYIAAEHLPPTQGRGFHYDIWLSRSPTSNVALSEAPQVASNGQLAGGAFLPSTVAEYHELLLTRETTRKPSHPGPVVLRGSYSLSA